MNTLFIDEIIHLTGFARLPALSGCATNRDAPCEVHSCSREELKIAVIDAIDWNKVQETMYGRNCAQPVVE